MQFCKMCGRFVGEEGTTTCPDDGAPLLRLDIPERDDPADALLGTLLDERYRLDSVVSHGGMGTIYGATQLPVGRPVAVKTLRGDIEPADLKRFVVEARATSRLQSPHTVTLHDFGVTGEGVPYLVTELLEGESLADRMRREGPLRWQEAAHIAVGVARSLEEAHGQGIVHRDLKPANVYLVETGGDANHAKVLDFGVALLSTEGRALDLTETGRVVGTPLYMAPEQSRSQPVGPWADLYALGVILYEMLAGRPPFLGETAVAVMLAHCQETPPPLAENNPTAYCPLGLERLLFDLLEKAPKSRPVSAAVVRNRLENTLRGLDVEAATSPRNEALVFEPALETAPSRADGAPDALTDGDEATSPVSAPRRAWGLVALLVFVLAIFALGIWIGAGRVGNDTPETLSVVAADARQPAAVAAPEEDEAPRQEVSVTADADGPRQDTAGSPDVASGGGSPDVASSVGVALPDVDEAGDGGAAGGVQGATRGTADAVVAVEAAPTRDDVGSPTGFVLATVPPGASVYGPGGERLGRTPLTLTSPGEPTRYVLRRRGWRTRRWTAPKGASGTIELELKKRPRPTNGDDGYESVDGML